MGVKGSEGYTKANMGESVKLPTEGYENEIAEQYRKLFASQLEVNIDDVIRISRDEYAENTEEDDE